MLSEDKWVKTLQESFPSRRSIWIEGKKKSERYLLSCFTISFNIGKTKIWMLVTLSQREGRGGVNYSQF